MAQQVGVIAVSSAVKNAGAVTWWRLSGDISTTRLYDAWVKRGWDVDDLPPLPSSQATLKRVLRDTYGGASTLIQALPNGAFAVVDIQVVAASGMKIKNDAIYTTRFKIHLDNIDELLESDNLSGPLLYSLQSAYDNARQTYEASMLSGWLVAQVEARKAIRLRDTGGIYFIPESYVKAWSAFGEVIAEVSASRVYEIPAVKNDQAMLALVEALSHELQQRVALLDQNVEERGLRGLRNKADRCEELASKVRVYESLFSTKLDSLSHMVSTLEGRITQAILQAEIEEST